MSITEVYDQRIAEQRIEARACRQLWCAVLHEQYQIVFPGTDSRRKLKVWHFETPEVKVAQRWFGSRNFEVVCALAGVEPEFVLRKFNARLKEAGQQ